MQGQRRLRAGVLALLPWIAACGVSLIATPDSEPDYLRYVAFEAPGNERVLLRWEKDDMPLRVFVPRPPGGLFADADAVWDATKRGIIDWSGAAGPGLPAFQFADRASDAHIPIAWDEVSGGWSVAHCFYSVNLFQRRFGVAQIVVTGRYRDGTETTPEFIYEVVLHEMGHALGLAGHSPNPEDAMYGFGRGPSTNLPKFVGKRIPPKTGSGLTARDRETLRLLYDRPVGDTIRGTRSAY